MLPLSISARGLSSCRLLGKLWPLPRIRREASTWTPSSFEPPRQIRAGYLKVLRRGFTLGGARFGRHLLKFLRL